MKKTAISGLLLSFLAAGCSQTTMTTATAPLPAAQRSGASAEAMPMKPADRCREAMARQMQARQNAAIAGSVLSAVGGFGGFAGRGGAIAGQALSVGGSIVRTQAQSGAQAQLMKECS